MEALVLAVVKRLSGKALQVYYMDEGDESDEAEVGDDLTTLYECAPVLEDLPSGRAQGAVRMPDDVQVATPPVKKTPWIDLYDDEGAGDLGWLLPPWPSGCRSPTSRTSPRRCAARARWRRP